MKKLTIIFLIVVVGFNLVNWASRISYYNTIEKINTAIEQNDTTKIKILAKSLWDESCFLSPYYTCYVYKEEQEYILTNNEVMHNMYYDPSTYTHAGISDKYYYNVLSVTTLFKLADIKKPIPLFKEKN